MTGFARSDDTTALGALHWELRSINHRFLDLQVKLPEALRAVESDVRARIGQQLSRGRVDAVLTLRAAPGRTPAGKLNLPLARQVIRHAETIARELGETASIDPLDVLRWPGVLEPEEPDPATAFPAVLAAFDTALAELAAARSREGERLAGLIEQRLAGIEERVAAVRLRLPEVHARMRERLRERLQALDVTAEPERMEQELALLVQRLDVSEELDRLMGHVAEVRASLAGAEPVGRRLDFLVQELNREANTLASKSADGDTTRHAVELKVLIEQIREQVQNVE